MKSGSILLAAGAVLLGGAAIAYMLSKKDKESTPTYWGDFKTGYYGPDSNASNDAQEDALFATVMSLFSYGSSKAN